MKMPGKLTRTALIFAFGVSLLAVGGCTKYASPDDLKKLDEANKAAVSAERDLATMKSQRSDMEKQVSKKQADLDAAKAESERVKTR